MFLPYNHSAVYGILLSVHSLLSHRFVCGQDLTTDQNCSCSGTGRMCNFENRYKPEDGSLNKENVALGKQTNLSTTHMPNETFLKREGCLAVNGDRGTTLFFLQTDPTIANCILTGHIDDGPYWIVYLDRLYTITNIVIYHQKGYEHRSISCTVLVDDQLCYMFNSTPPTVFNFKCERTLKGEVVVASGESYTNPESALTFCEFEVWVCIQGFFGPDCEFSCGNCMVWGCDAETGSCPTEGFSRNIQPGVSPCKFTMATLNPFSLQLTLFPIKIAEMPGILNECLEGYYGNGCFLKCGACKDQKCHFNGSCITGCQDGFTSDNCTQEDMLCAEIIQDSHVSTVEATHSSMGSIVGAVSVFLGLSGVLFLLIRRKMRRRQQPACLDQKAIQAHTEPAPAKPQRKLTGNDWELVIRKGGRQNGECSRSDEEVEEGTEGWESEITEPVKRGRVRSRRRLPVIPEEDEEDA